VISGFKIYTIVHSVLDCRYFERLNRCTVIKFVCAVFQCSVSWKLCCNSEREKFDDIFAECRVYIYRRPTELYFFRRVQVRWIFELKYPHLVRIFQLDANDGKLGIFVVRERTHVACRNLNQFSFESSVHALVSFFRSWPNSFEILHLNREALCFLCMHISTVTNANNTSEGQTKSCEKKMSTKIPFSLNKC